MAGTMSCWMSESGWQLCDSPPCCARHVQVLGGEEEEMPEELRAGAVRRPALRPASQDKRGVWALPYAAALQPTPEDVAEVCPSVSSSSKSYTSRHLGC